jgi:hypothetical protein
VRSGNACGYRYQQHLTIAYIRRQCLTGISHNLWLNGQYDYTGAPRYVCITACLYSAVLGEQLKFTIVQITGPDILRLSAFGNKAVNEAIGHISGANKTNYSTFQNFSLVRFRMLSLLRKSM